ncbi:iron-siderophore ABC transporter substrate-binding protein [Corynebacterium uterequi]|uniref:ABC-type Fe3+-hydroxamate transport system, periplasmic component n=1 Tax=Corynebacterium uterequi TaxID=1072256 RepID=A0A0G3HF91_9CORY|nr:iron-siderophore ABC transporter substrate-binding protein [Corynebacterium uterequi]AKK12021.1 ABC-type Fe3+-hydroxamate transport system, periplasmic component [Corynebacterium uterequi]
MRIFPRRCVAIMATALASAVALTGCTRGPGETEATSTPGSAVAASEERVASLGLGDVDTLLALGVTPVAIAPWGSEGDADPSGVGPWSKELLGDAEPVKIFNTGAGFTADVLEQVTASDPSLIVAVNQAVDANAKSSLEKIAPTVVKPEEFPDWQVPWEKQVVTIAEAVGKEAEGAELVEKTEQTFVDFRKEHADVQGKKAAIVMPYDGKIGLYTSGDGRGQFIENLGFEIPAELEGDGSSFFVDYAPENYAALNGVDYLFVLDYYGAVDALKDDPTFQNLEVVKDGRVRYLETDVGNAMSMPNPVTIPWASEKVADKL